jgi:hypothetical protein
MAKYSRIATLVSTIVVVLVGLAIVSSVPAQDQRFRDGRMRLALPPQNTPPAALNGGPNVLGVIPPLPIQARALGTPVLVGGNFGQQGQIGTSGSLGSIGNIGNLGSQGNLGFGSLGNVGAIGGTLGSFGSFGLGGSLGSFGSLGIGGSLGALGGQIGAFGGGAFGKTGALGANGAIGL